MKKQLHIIPLLAIAVVGTVATACFEDDSDASPVYGIGTWMTRDSINGGSHYLFTVEARAYTGTLAELTLSSYNPTDGLKELEKVTLSGTTYKYEYDYMTPILPDSVTDVQLRVRIKNSDGETWNGIKHLKVYSTDFRLRETTGLTIYEKPAMGHNNALNLMGGGAQPILTTVEKFDSIKNVVAYYDADGDDAMRLGFYTESQSENTNVFMGKATNFNYAEASYKSVRSAFENAADLGRTVSDLKVNDIILVGLVSGTNVKTPLAVIRVMQIYDEEGKDNDRYELNVKTMQRQQ